MLSKIRKNPNILILLAITLFAGALRFSSLDRFPPGLHFDEAFHQVEAVEILKGVMPLYFTENMGMDAMHIYLIAALFRLFGVTHIGGRLVSALAGTLTIPALWWLVVELFAQWETQARTVLAGVSTFTLATLQWHLTMSRTGIQPVLVPLLLTLTLAALWRGLRKGHRGWFIVAGIFLGLGPYAYSSARMTPLLIVLVFAWLLLFDRPLLRRRWWGFALCAAVSILVFAPLGAYFVTHWEQFTYRSAQVT
ncbi:MAG: glycosyltransferase family 39 protein, partial [Anaerolineae bacterium]|nr:glycosyltransferase family 39 protein [Anaerolineae bacterium]